LGLKERLSHGRFGERRLRVNGLLILETRKAYATLEPSTGQEERNHALDVLLKQFGCKSLVIDN
jgi:hypothetical protein